jgi:hypothetical protein
MTNLQNNLVETVQPVVKRGRGRPKGAKNKIKTTSSETLVSLNPPGEPRRRGRPRGAKNKTTLVKEESEARVSSIVAAPIESLPVVGDSIEVETHPVLLAAKWLEKKMPVIEVQYYRTRATRMGVSLTTSIALGVLSLFNVQDQEIRKQIKSN